MTKKGTGEITDVLTDDGRNAAAVALGRKGGLARAKTLTKERRIEIARKGAAASAKARTQSDPQRWSLKKKLAYVRKRLAAYDAMGRNPTKRMSLWPLTFPEAMGVIFSKAKAKPISPDMKEMNTWRDGENSLRKLRKHLQPPSSPTRE